MLNIYRVIALILVMSLFFAAPLLCVHPVSFQPRNEQGLVVKRDKAKRLIAAQERDSQASRGTDALANSLRRARNMDDVPEDTISPAAFVQEQAEDWDKGWDDADQTAGFGGVSPVSETSIYY